RAGEIADVVVVEAEERAEPGGRQRLAGAVQPVGVQAPEVDPLLEVHRRVPRGGDLARPIVSGLERLGRDGFRLDGTLGHGSSRWGANACRVLYWTAGCGAPSISVLHTCSRSWAKRGEARVSRLRGRGRSTATISATRLGRPFSTTTRSPIS